MALTATRVAKFPTGSKVMAIYDVALDNSYPAGGYAISGATFSLRRLSHLDPGGITPSGYALSWDKVNSKLRVFRSKDPAAVGGADIVLQEVTAGVNLSAETINCKAIGSN